MNCEEVLFDFRDLMKDLLVNLQIITAHRKSNIKLRNPHCPGWNQCESDDCFMCGFNLKGSEQYALEKLTVSIIKDMMK